MAMESILPAAGVAEEDVKLRLQALLSALPADSPTNAALAAALGAESPEGALEVIPFSSEDGTGRDDILGKIEEVCYAEVEVEEDEEQK